MNRRREGAGKERMYQAIIERTNERDSESKRMNKNDGKKEHTRA